MEDNIYDHIMSGMDKLPNECDKKKFFEDFWSTLNREEKIVFTIDALESFERDGTLKPLINDINENIGKKQDVIMDQFISKEISTEEYIERIKKIRKIETKSDRKK